MVFFDPFGAWPCSPAALQRCSAAALQRCISFEACCLDVDWENMQVLGGQVFEGDAEGFSEISQYNQWFFIFTNVSYILGIH